VERPVGEQAGEERRRPQQAEYGNHPGVQVPPPRHLEVGGDGEQRHGRQGRVPPGPVTEIPDEEHRRLYERLYALVTDIESSSFYMGYHLALGLAAGNCRAVFCHGEDRCWAMVKGRGCIHPYKGRPSMETVGIDTRVMARSLSMTGESDNRLLAGLVMIV
jgi:hypothetical protein